MNRGLSFIGALCAIALPLVGCGGGGSKSKGPSESSALTLSFSGDAGSASGPVGTSQHIVVYRSDDSIVYEKTVDVPSGTTQVNLTDLPSGTLRLHLGLLQSGSATEVGAIDTSIQGGVALNPMAIVMRQPVSQVVVSPASGTVNARSTLQLYAAARTVEGNYVYTAPSGTASSGWNWTSSATTASVNAAGIVTGGDVQGSADITATHVASGASAFSTIGVLPSGITQGKWTVMVYLNAANNLYQDAVLNVNQMEKVANNPNVRFVIQWKQIDGSEAMGAAWSGTRRYLAAYDTSSAIKSTLVQNLGGGVDMGSGGALSNFVDWAKTNYPADHYALVVWDHGSGWYFPTRAMTVQTRGISLDDETGNLMSPEEVRSALLGRHVDILSYDACLMQSAEMLFETATSADYLVSSEDNTPEYGYPYDTVFKPFADNPDASVSDLAKSFATGFLSAYNGSGYSNWAIQQSVIETSKMPALHTALSAFGQTLVNNRASLGSLMSDVRKDCSTTDSSGTFPAYEYLYYDLDQICAATASKTTNSGVASAANAVRAALADMTVISTSNTRGSFLKGLSIEFSKSSKFNSTYAPSYSNLQLAATTQWDEFLKDTLANP